MFLAPLWFTVLIFCMLGLVIGSFLNVVIHRLNSGQSIMRGRSHCDACGRTLAWFELVPLVSFFWQRGRSRCCQVRLSWQYVVVEAVTGLAFGVLVYQLGVSGELVMMLLVTTVLIVITVYDFRHMIIPDVTVIWLLAFGVVALVGTVAGLQLLELESYWWLHVVAAVALPAPFFLLWLFSKGRLMGLGDIKLMIPMGLFLGVDLGISALILAFWLGALVALALGLYIMIQHLRDKRRTTRWLGREVPFGPYLCMAFWFVLLFQFTIVDVVLWIFT